MTFAPIQNRLGVQPVGTTVTCVNKSGTSVAIGDLVITSFIHAGAVVNPEQAANTGYVFNCIRKAVSTETGNTGYLGVVTGLMTGAGGNGREVQVQFGGICQAKVLVNATVSSGTLLGVSATAGVLSNAVSTSDYSVTLMDNAAVADGTALKRVYIPTEYSFNTGTVVPGVYGSKSAARFILDAVNNTASLDCLWVGDSNTGYQGFGWCDGFQHGLCQAGANMYATMINFPYNDQYELGYRTRIFGSFEADPASAQGLVAGTSVSSGASATLKQTYSIGSGKLGVTGTGGNFPASTPPNFVDVPSARVGSPGALDLYTNTALWVYMRKIQTSGGAADISTSFGAPCPINFNGELKFRAQLNIRSGGTGSFTTRWGNSAGQALTGTGVVATQNTTTVSASPDVWDTYVHTLAANADRYVYPGTNGGELIRMTIDGGTTGTGGITHRTSVGCCSIYRPNTIGTSNSIMEYRGGATLTDLAFDISEAAGGFCKMLLKETRDRQIVAGGSGRVLLCIQGGVNNGDWSPSNAAAAITAVEGIKTSIKAQWAALGYPATDLYFLFMVSHPVEAGDTNLGILRTLAQAYYTNSTDTLFVNLNEIAPYEKILSNNWYQFEGGTLKFEHFAGSGRGYETISSAIVSNICRFA
jgi:hypothetical protein